MAFDDETIDVLIAGYLSRDAAHDDFESVRRQWRLPARRHGRRQGPRRQPIGRSRPTTWCVRAPEGMATVGFVLGLFVPPLLLASTAVGAATGAGMGMLLHRVTAHELKERAGATIPIGGAGLIVAYPKSSAEKVRPAVKRAISIAIGEAEGHRLKALTGALADAQRKMATADA